MASYWTYYLLWMFLAYALRRPWFLAGVVAFLVLRRFIPDPTALLRALSRGRALRAQVELNPANIVARRDLATIYLDVLRPRAALECIEAALTRTPNDPELLYLSGVALHRSGRHEQALAPLVRAVDLDARIRFGAPYLVAGDALSALGRHEEAVDAYERYVASNSSDVIGYVRLARAEARRGDHATATKVLDEGLDTWTRLPSWRKRHAFFRGYVGAFWTRVWWLREPMAIVFASLLALIVAGTVFTAAPLVVQAVGRAHASAPSMPRFLGDRIIYQGKVFQLKRRYASYAEYEEDSDHLDRADLLRIEKLLTEAKIGPSFVDWHDFRFRAGAFRFPGYRMGLGPRCAGNGHLFTAYSLEIPGTNRHRFFVLEEQRDGSLELVDDFVAFADEEHWPAAVELNGKTLQYFTNAHSLVRETKL